ncbi:MAG TPA: lysozyme inhibitor LprI family protein [Xanthobacteraceae bacterium]|nr:lysozyme inhibitor LprI family protein [Xanthobacteraceae bacterium]
MQRTIALLFPALLAAPAAPAAESGWYGADFQPCADKPTAQLVDCVKERTAHWDRLLNRTYQQLIGRVAPEQRERLRAAQRLWVQYRDANCGFYAAGEGTIASVEAAECLRAMTQLRYQELNGKMNPP